MKNTISFLIFSICLLSFSNAQTLDEKDREMFKKHNVNARVKWDYNFKGDVPSSTGKKTAESFYDKNGRVLKSFSFNLKEDTVNYDRYEYDSKGNRTLYERKSLYGKYKKESEYNQANNLIEEEGYDGGATFQTIYKYDNQNRILEITYLIVDDVDEKRIYTYSGNKATVKILKLGKHLSSKMEILFNDNNQVLEEKLLNLDGKVIERKVMKYNSRNDIVKEEKYKNNEFFYRITYEYNSVGSLLSIAEESPTKTKFIKKKFGYDDQERIVSYQWKRNPDDAYNIKKFKYDSQGVCNEEHTYYPRTNYKLLTKYEYVFY